MVRTQFKCTGFGKEYVIEASSNWMASYNAAKQYKEETKDGRPAGFLAFYFRTDKVVRKKPGRKKAALEGVIMDGKDEG